MGVRFIDCPADSVPAVTQFFAAMYSPQYVMARDAAFLIWQFSGFDGHVDGEPLHLKLAMVDDKLAGCVGYIPVDLQIAGRSLRAAWAANWMVDDGYRRLGLGPLLIRELSKGFEVTLALGGNSDAHQLLPRMGWTDFGQLPRYVRVLDQAGGALLTSSGDLSWPVTDDSPASDNGVDVLAVTQFDDRAAILWDRVHGCTGAGTRRSAAFLNWRYQRHPTFDYVRLEARRRGLLEGVAVYRIEHVKDLPVRIARIVELIASPEAAEPLIDDIVARARQADAAALDFFCSSRLVASPLQRRGFLLGTEAPASEIPMLFQPVDRSRTGVLFMAHLRADAAGATADWYVTTADGDQDRPS